MSNENQLTESQLFTIEALNKIQEFVWPKNANYAFVNNGNSFVSFTSVAHPVVVAGADAFFLRYGIYVGDISIGCAHPDWLGSSISKAQFDSVDGWVRACGVMPNGNIEVDIKRYPDGSGFQSGSLAKFINWNDVKLWRYHKRANEKVIPEAVNQSIDQLINACNAWQKAKANADTSRAILQLAEKDESDAREAVYCALRAVWWGAK